MEKYIASASILQRGKFCYMKHQKDTCMQPNYVYSPVDCEIYLKVLLKLQKLPFTLYLFYFSVFSLAIRVSIQGLYGKSPSIVNITGMVHTTLM